MLDVFAFAVLGGLTAIFLGVGYDFWKRRNYFFGAVLGLLGVAVFGLTLASWMMEK
jgi:hypothetical protein